METLILLLVAGVAVAGVAAQWLGWKLRVPAIIPLLAMGMLTGPVLGWVKPSAILGEVTRPGVGLAVAIIVFEGGLNLNLRELRSAGSGIARLVAIALPLNWALGTAVGHYIGRLSWPVALLFGSMLVVTGPTVVMPLLRQARLEPRAAAFLKWEAIVNDPIGATLTLLLLGYLVLSKHVGGHVALPLLAARGLGGVAAAGALGAGAPFVIRAAFRRDLVPEYLKTPLLLAGALGIYAVGEVIQPETGLVGATLFGAVLANIDVVGLHELRRFKESLTVFLVSGLFIVLSANIDPKVLRSLTWPIALVVLAVLFVVRPLSTCLATVGARMTWKERLLVGWIGPRGVVAAAVAGVAGTELQAAGYHDGADVLPMVFGVIACTVLLHGLSLGPLARLLGLASAERPGLLVVGASAWTVDLGQILGRLGAPVILADRSWDALRPARRLGLRTFHAEVLSAIGEEVLDLRDAEYLLAATDDDAYNALVCARFAPEFGRERVAQFAPQLGSERADIVRDWRGKVVMDRALHHARLTSLCGDGWVFVAHKVEAPGVIPEVPGPEGWPVVTVHANGQLTFFSPEHEAVVAPGDRVVSFYKPAEGAAPLRTRRRWPFRRKPIAVVSVQGEAG